MPGGAIRSHSTTKAWTGPRMETNLGDAGESPQTGLRLGPPVGSPDGKRSYKFIHDEVGARSEVEAANVRPAPVGSGFSTAPEGERMFPQPG